MFVSGTRTSPSPSFGAAFYEPRRCNAMHVDSGVSVRSTGTMWRGWGWRVAWAWAVLRAKKELVPRVLTRSGTCGDAVSMGAQVQEVRVINEWAVGSGLDADGG